jgi:hypothetical protein
MMRSEPQNVKLEAFFGSSLLMTESSYGRRGLEYKWSLCTPGRQRLSSRTPPDVHIGFRFLGQA